MLWVIFALLTGAAVFSILWPLSRTPKQADARELDVAFYKAQTTEIERDKARGVLGREEAEVARAEAGRRLVSAASRPANAKTSVSPWGVRLVALFSLVFVPVLGLGLYRHVGAGGMPDEPLEARLHAPPAKMDIGAAIARIEDHLAKDPNDAKGWSLLAPIYLRLQRYDDAVRAFAAILRLRGPSAQGYSSLGEAQVFASGNNTVTPEAQKSFEKAVELEPRTPRAQFYLGLAAEQAGDKPKAVALWRKLEAESPGDAPWLPTVRQHIAAATGVAPPAVAGAPPSISESGQRPNAAAVAAMPPGQQQAMIHRMVDGLAQRLKSNGQDIEGWLRLVRAYRVLNEQDKAKVALSDAKRTFAADPSATKRLDALAHELGLEG